MPLFAEFLPCQTSVLVFAARCHKWHVQHHYLQTFPELVNQAQKWHEKRFVITGEEFWSNVIAWKMNTYTTSRCRSSHSKLKTQRTTYVIRCTKRHLALVSIRFNIAVCRTTAAFVHSKNIFNPLAQLILTRMKYLLLFTGAIIRNHQNFPNSGNRVFTLNFICQKQDF